MKQFVLIFLFFIFYFLNFHAIFSQQEPQIIFTWQANNFFPADYKGKALIGSNSQVTVAIEAIQNNKFVDLSRAVIVWHIDGKFYNKGTGLKEINFSTDKLRGDDYFVRAVIQNNKDSFESSIRVPVSGQSLVVKIPYANNTVAVGNKILLEAIPYFFNVTSLKDLAFFWSVSDTIEQTVGDNQLTLNIPTGERVEPLTLNLTAQNTKNKLEVAKTAGKILIR